jgi:catechol 2,3-dioxygenase-like lactoylglutathione lyase family enzyme
MPLGRFLEVSIAVPDIAASLAFYESLGFVQANAREAWPYPYVVVTDGRLYLGLHQRAEPTGAALTWVLPELAQQLPRLESLGLAFNDFQIDDVALNRADFVDPSGQAVTLLEARTFSPPALPATHASALGYFEEFGIPTLELAAAAAFWERLGFVAFDAVAKPFGKIVATGRDLNLGLYDLDLPGPVLAFSDPDMAARIEALRDKGYLFAKRVPRGLAAADAAILQAPEGTALLLLAASDD